MKPAKLRIDHIPASAFLPTRSREEARRVLEALKLAYSGLLDSEKQVIRETLGEV